MNELKKYFKLGNDGYYYGVKSGRKYTALDAARWLTQNHIGNYNAQSFVREFDRQNPQQLLSSNNFFSAIGKGLSGYVKDFFTYQGNGNAFMKLTTPGHLYIMGKNIHEASQLEDQSQQLLLTLQRVQTTRTPRPNAGFSTDRFDFEEHPMESARKRYNGSPAIEPPAVTATDGTIVAPTISNEWETKYNNLNTKYEQVLKELNELKNPTKPAETTAETVQPATSTYESLVQANTAAFNNGMSNAYWRKNFRQNFNASLRSGNMYNLLTGQGNLVFDLAGLNMGTLLSNPDLYSNYIGENGLSRRGLRRLIKDYKKGNIGISMSDAISRFNGTPSIQATKSNTENLDYYEPINYGVRQLGVDSNIIGPQLVDTGERDITSSEVPSGWVAPWLRNEIDIVTNTDRTKRQFGVL